mmetsp:Transcript_23735/g.45251  ORF Transcript_23735/g.45251 Transcript_23735/m.45251 type:complete len:152 (+) Transcript_23735:944-1399(+)
MELCVCLEVHAVKIDLSSSLPAMHSATPRETAIHDDTLLRSLLFLGNANDHRTLSDIVAVFYRIHLPTLLSTAFRTTHVILPLFFFAAASSSSSATATAPNDLRGNTEIAYSHLGEYTTRGSLSSQTATATIPIDVFLPQQSPKENIAVVD